MLRLTQKELHSFRLGYFLGITRAFNMLLIPFSSEYMPTT